MRLALVTPSLDQTFSGVTSYIRDLVPRLCDAGLKVTVVTTDLGYRGVPANAIAVLDNRVDLRIFPVKGRLNRRLYRSVELDHWMRDSLGDFDIVDIQQVWSFVAVDTAAACPRAKTPFVFTPHGAMTRWDWAKRPWSKRIFYQLRLKRVWQRATAVRFLSQGERDSSMVPPSCSVAVIPNAIPPQPEADYAQVSRRLLGEIGIPDGANVILFLGRLTAQKSVRELIHAFDRLWSQRRETFLILAGPLEGNYGESVRSLAQTCLSRDHIRLLGSVNGEKKRAAFAAASLFVTLSKSEGMPITALEAISSGLPVVLTRESNFPEVETHGAGVLVRPGPAEVARVVGSLLDDPDLLQRMGRNGLNLYRGNYTWDKVLPQLIAFYENVAVYSKHRPSRLN